jgi:inosose dehydratase
MNDLMIAGAPISWGVCEVPGWGYQLPAARVLQEMRSLGLTATELGPHGYLPDDPADRADLLSRFGLLPAGCFVPVVLHDPAVDPLPNVEEALDGFGLSDTAVLVLAASTGCQGYESRRPEMDTSDWSRLLANLDRISALAAERGFTVTLHPHVGTMVEKHDDVGRVLDGSEISLCLDTGHLLIGGTDPADLAKQMPTRVGHVHLKDVREAVARKVMDGEISYADAVGAGLYQPLGLGDVDVAGTIAALTGAGYHGWYVLEQDVILPGPPTGEGPVAEVRQSLAYLRSLT